MSKLKIDIDGPELKALKGGETIIRRCKPIILLEISPDSEDRHGIHFSEVVHWLECLNYSVYKPTINLEKQDPECDLDYVANKAKTTEVQYALNNSFGFGGTNSALVLKKFVS